MAGAGDPVAEGDYIETEDGLFFAVKGLVHPPDRILAVLRYMPDPGGNRQRQGQRYRRLYHFEEQEAILRSSFPHYLAFEPSIGAVLQSVPRMLVRRVYSPRERLQELAHNGLQDELEKDALDFARRLCTAGGIPIRTVGISGSLLIRMHTPDSDLDLIVYGRQNCWALYTGLKHLLDDRKSGEISRLEARGMEALYAERSAGSSMSLAEFIACEQKKVNQGQFRGRTYFLRFLKNLDEIEAVYSQRRYRSEGQAEVIARIAGDEDRIFTPCCYHLENVRWLSDFNGTDLREAVSYRGRFCEAARRGEWVLIRGMVERVETSSGKGWRRLLLGNSAGDALITGKKPLVNDP